MTINHRNRQSRRRMHTLQKTIPATLMFALAMPVPLFAQSIVKEKNMPTVVVKEKAIASPGDVKGYKTGTSRSSTRTETALIDTPQSISVVTQDQVRDQGISSMGEAVRYVPGVAIQQGEGHRDQLSIRGNVTTADFFIDGARDDVQYYRDFYNIDRIEVLKGPNAMAFGRGGSGGAINRVSKAADGERVRQLAVTAGAYDRRRVQADIGGQFSDAFAFRLNAMTEDSGTFRQYGDLERRGVNPTVTLKAGENTSIQAGYEYFNDNRFNDRGIPSMGGLPYHTAPETFFGDPNQNVADAIVNSGYAVITHDFSADTSVRNYTRYTDNSRFYQNVYAGSAVSGAGTLSIVGYNNNIERGNFTNQTDLTRKFSTGSLKHTALAGMEVTRQDSDAFRNTAFFNNVTTSVTVSAGNPITTVPITFRQSATDADNRSEVRVYAGYLQDQVEITDSLQVIGGLRYDRFDIDFHNNRTGASLSRDDGLLSPRLGVVVKPKADVSVYGSYSTSYLPSSGDQFATLTQQLQGLKPEHLENYEIGAKWDVTPALNVSAAVYQLDRENTSATDPNDPTQLVPTGASRTRGAELAATGHVTGRWQVIGGYAYQDAEITKTTAAAPAGRKAALVPRHMASLWNKYDFTPQWAAAIGVIHQTDQFAAVDNTVRLKGFTRFDGAVFYNLSENHRFQLNFENLLDREYALTAHNNNNISPGSPRTFWASVIANF